MTGTVELERLDNGIARVTLDNQAKLNAINDAMWQRLRALFAELSADDALRCVILTGAGEKAFSAGADISEFEQNRSSMAKAREYEKRTHGALDAIAGCRHPVVAQVRGLCVGGGLELAATCDLRISAASARFGIPIKRLGLVVAHAEMQGLMNLVGYSNALEILLEGRIIDSEDALRMGLINRVVADHELESQVLDSACRIAEGAPLAARWHKKFARRLLEPTPLTADEREESLHCFDSEDFHIGYQAFLDKQKPAFKGK